MKEPSSQMKNVSRSPIAQQANARAGLIRNPGDAVSADSRYRERLAVGECIACFYGPRVGRPAISEELCMCCGKVQLFSGVNNGVICIQCAKMYRLCRHCGADLEPRFQRNG